MKFENSKVMNFKGAFRGLRNPMNSWYKSDSYGGILAYCDDIYLEQVATAWVEHENQIRAKHGQPLLEEGSNDYLLLLDKYMGWLEQGILDADSTEAGELFYIGPNDLSLAQRMINAGSSDRKFMRQILVSVDITAPLYWWKEFDTYKVGTVANSTSTMHKITSCDMEDLSNYETDDYDSRLQLIDPIDIGVRISQYLNDLEQLKQKYLQTKDRAYWKELIRWMPNGWLQTRTVTMNYEILRNIYSQRRHHKLTEWHSFCDWIKSLPYAGELVTIGID